MSALMLDCAVSSTRVRHPFEPLRHRDRVCTQGVTYGV
jgi:hypothetical protein